MPFRWESTICMMIVPIFGSSTQRFSSTKFKLSFSLRLKKICEDMYTFMGGNRLFMKKIILPGFSLAANNNILFPLSLYYVLR